MAISQSKAILLIDEPVSNNGECPCRNCLLHVVEYDDYYHHYVCQSETTSIPDEWEIYKKCPLMSITTVEAIPIRWIERFMSQYELYGATTEEYHLLHYMLTLWEKENEESSNSD